MSEVESDKCITQLLGTWSATNGQTCVTTKECLQVENQPHKKGYALTHQFLYFLSGIKYGLFVPKFLTTIPPLAPGLIIIKSARENSSALESRVQTSNNVTLQVFLAF